ncbi:voltage-gated potassium channel [Friedmanniella endophytica]|uniref:Voltage-gated potassium channel n=1 Tax=Microlunatus kandeliicorticis TaxID=1759536 RepID=A0A7W3IPN6_9ACTN|nr:potassium channel family protein [Microlunatus kandeliicorticis]MBA8792910.1 voltage-gated potassium channel [Microlunatus kandeliicorticis]
MTVSPDAWQRRVEWPLAVAALVFLAAYSWLVLDPGLPTTVRRTLVLLDYATWALFAIDYAMRVLLAGGGLRGRLSYLRHHLLDLLIVLLPVLRPLRLLRLIALLRFIDRRASKSLQGRVAVYVALSTVLVLYAGALAELAAERGAPGANIETFGTSLWWAVTTITTVGYGDVYPVTTEGRWVAAALMVAGVALLGVVTASLASWFVARVRRDEPPAEPTVHPEVIALRAEVRELTAELRVHRAGREPPGS